MKILNFIACMILPISIINSGYTMEDTGFNNPIFKIFNNSDENNLLSASYFAIANNNSLISEPLNNNGNLHLDPNSSRSSDSPNSENRDIRLLYGAKVNNNGSNLNASIVNNNVNVKYEKLISEMVELSLLISSGSNNIINTDNILKIINNIFDDINNSNKNINIMSLKHICNKYDKSNTIFNCIKNNNIFVEHKAIQIMRDLLSNFFAYTCIKEGINSIDNITKELEGKINEKVKEVINSNAKYNGANVKVIVDIDLDRKNELAQELSKMENEHTSNKKKIFDLLKLNNDKVSSDNYDNFIDNILKGLKDTDDITTLYEILNNINYINDNGTADRIYNNIVCKDLNHSHKIIVCLENILKTKEEIKQIWSDFKKNNKK